MHEEEFRQLNQRLLNIEKQIARANTAPTIPTYDSNHFPQDAVRSQIAKDLNNNLWVFGQDDIWHQIGGQTNLPICYLEGSGTRPSTSAVWRPTWSSFQTNDSSVFPGLVSSDHTLLQIASAGMYLVDFGIIPSFTGTNITIQLIVNARAHGSVLFGTVSAVPLNGIEIIDPPEIIASKSASAVLKCASNDLPWKFGIEIEGDSGQSISFADITAYITRLSVNVVT